MIYKKSNKIILTILKLIIINLKLAKVLLTITKIITLLSCFPLSAVKHSRIRDAHFWASVELSRVNIFISCSYYFQVFRNCLWVIFWRFG